MAIALVQHTTYFANNGTATGAQAFASPVTPGNLLVVVQADGHSASDVPTISDNINGAWGAPLEQISLPVDGDNNLIWIFPNTAGGTLTISSVIGGAGTVQFHISEWSGIALSSPFDNTNNAYSANAGSLTTGPITPSQAIELIFGFVGTDSNEPTPTIGGGFTALDSTQNLATCYKIISAIAAQAPSFAFINGNCECGAIVVGLKAPPGGAVLAGAAADSTSATGALNTQITPAAAAADTSSATGSLNSPGATLASSAADSNTATGALTTAIKAAAAAADSSSATGALTNFASVTLSGVLYSGVGGILDPNFWTSSVPSVGTVVWYDSAHIVVSANAEISADTNNCQAVVQFFDGTNWQIGLVVITPNMVAYANATGAAAGVLTTAIQLLAAATSLSSATGALTTQIKPAAAAADVSTASAALTTAINLLAGAVDSSTATGALPGSAAALASNAADSNLSSAALSTAIQLAAAATDVVTASGALSTAILLASSAGTSSTVQANLAGQQIVLAAAPADAAAATALLLTQIRLSAAAIEVSNAAGALSTQILALSSAVDTSSAHADFTTFDPIASSPSTITAATGALTALIRLASGAISSSAAAGALSTAIQLSVSAATAENVAATLGNVPRFHFGWAIVIAISQTVQGARQAYIEQSASEIAATFFDTTGAGYKPQGLRYRIDDVLSGAQIKDWTILQSAASAMITVSSEENSMISLTRSHEAHQVLIEITDDFGDVSDARVVFDVYRVVGIG